MLSTLRYILTGGGLIKRPSRPVDGPDSHQLVDKYLRYRSLSRAAFPGCDGLLHTAIGQAAGGCTEVKIVDFEGLPGQWFRSPDHDCHPLHSASDISKDMMMGLALWCSVFRAEKVAARTLRRALLRAGNMGRPWWLISRTLMSPNLMYLFWLLSRPGRRPGLLGRLLLASNHILPQLTYRAHLQSLSILILARLEGGLNPISARLLDLLIKKNPGNGLFHAIRGNQAECKAILLNKNMFPEDRPPNNKQEHSIDYLWSRDPEENIADFIPDGPDWPFQVHPGTDLLFASAIYLGMLD